MSIFDRKHQHQQWKVIGARFHPPRDDLHHVYGFDTETIREVLYGVTVLTQQCTECGWVTTSRNAGQADLEALNIKPKKETNQ